VDCNSQLKFGALLARARHLYGCDAVATGHYARVEVIEDASRPGGRRFRLLAGLDRDKDQSYFLYGLQQDQLAHTRFPLGALQKPQVRDAARRHGLVTADKPESQEICFVPGGDYRQELTRRVGWQPSPGALVDADGTVVGSHAGTAAYTIGQRSGLGVALGERQYVAAIDVPANLIRLGRREDLQREILDVGDVSFVDRAPDGPFQARVRIRHRAPLVPALVSPLDEAAEGAAVSTAVSAANQADGSRWRVELEEAAWAPAPGQAAVFYGEGDAVIGGGRIASAA
jgi:tRNA-specific 2-thiouridylase